MNIQKLAQCEAGSRLPEIVAPALSRTTCALFAGASGDHNPIHIDIDVARAAGLPDVIGHGMYSMAMLARVVTGWAPQVYLRRLGARFQGVTSIGDIVAYSGVVIDRIVDGRSVTMTLELQAVDQQGRVKTVGDATICFPKA